MWCGASPSFTGRQPPRLLRSPRHPSPVIAVPSPSRRPPGDNNGDTDRPGLSQARSAHPEAKAQYRQHGLFQWSSPVLQPGARPIRPVLHCSPASQPAPTCCSPAECIRSVRFRASPDRTTTTSSAPPIKQPAQLPEEDIQRRGEHQVQHQLLIKGGGTRPPFRSPPPSPLTVLPSLAATASRRPLRPPPTTKTSRTWELSKLGPGIPTTHTTFEELGEKERGEKVYPLEVLQRVGFLPRAVDLELGSKTSLRYSTGLD